MAEAKRNHFCILVIRRSVLAGCPGQRGFLTVEAAIALISLDKNGNPISWVATVSQRVWLGQFCARSTIMQMMQCFLQL